ncbi:hypothetical protein [Chromobacterium vaccinii]|uniref:hypothetical protein n=1 Tax=Chromobacterium vaccinii TaxID=1108595 RepID=UPI0034586EDB
MTLSALAEKIRDDDLLQVERLINLELLKRRLVFQDQPFYETLRSLRMEVRSTCLRLGFETSLGELDDYVDATLDCLQFGWDHGVTMMKSFTGELKGLSQEGFEVVAPVGLEQGQDFGTLNTPLSTGLGQLKITDHEMRTDLTWEEEFSTFVGTVKAIQDEVMKNLGNRKEEILSHDLFPLEQRLAEVSYENDLRAGYHWWLGVQGIIPEENIVGNAVFDEHLKFQWNAVRSGASLIGIPCRVPKLRINGGDDYDISLVDSEDKGEWVGAERINLHISLGWDVDGDLMLLNLLKKLRLAWVVREWEMLNKGALHKPHKKSLLFDEDKLLNMLEKRVFRKTIKKDQVEPFFLGMLCWDANRRLNNLEKAVENVLAIVQVHNGREIHEDMYARVKRGYFKVRKEVEEYSA